MSSKAKEGASISVVRVEQESLTFRVLGRTPLICNAMSAKAKQELLLPAKKKTAAEKGSTLKHNPLEEYRDSVYFLPKDNAPTYIAVPSTSFKSGLRSVAIDLPGSTKAEVGRLTYVEGTYIPVYGVPQLMTSIVRNSGMNKTPDVRSRAVLPRWACEITVVFTSPLMKAPDVVNLLAAAGLMRGIGDWRPEKGSGDFGQYTLVGEDDPDYRSIVSTGGRGAQLAALESPSFFDSETEQLYTWFSAEARRRGFKEVV